MNNEVTPRQGHDDRFCPPVEEGMTITLEDENGDLVNLEFLGALLYNDRRYGFFFPVDEQTPAGSSGEVILLEITEIDEEDQPVSFELVVDEAIAFDVYNTFKEATKDIYTFEEI